MEIIYALLTFSLIGNVIASIMNIRTTKRLRQRSLDTNATLDKVDKLHAEALALYAGALDYNAKETK